MYNFTLLDLINLEKLVIKEYWVAKANGHIKKYNELGILLNKITAQKIEFGYEVQ